MPYIEKIRIQNFKSFDNAEIEFDDFNVIIGPNAAGKSNLMSALKFIKDIQGYGLKNAISLQGGYEFLTNIRIGNTKELSIGITLTDLRTKKEKIISKENKKEYILCKDSTEYDFSIKFIDEDNFEITKDILKHKMLFLNSDDVKDIYKEGTVYIKKEENNIEALPGADFPEEFSFEDIIPTAFYSFIKQFYKDEMGEKIFSNKLMLEIPVCQVTIPWADTLSNLSRYEIDSKVAKKAIPITGKAVLEEDCSNLTIILKKILDNEKSRDKFALLMQDYLPFINNMAIERLTDRSLYFKIKEIYASDKYLPALLLSDGTVNVIELIIMLHFEMNDVTIIEEPDKGIHPQLISKLMNDIIEISSSDDGPQIMITTHNPELLRWAGIDNMIFIYRDSEGFSRVSYPKENEEIKTFLKNDIGIGELYIQNLLEP